MPLPIDAAFLELGRTLLDQPLPSVMKRVATLVVETIPSADDVSVNLMRGPSAHTVAFHGDLAVDLDERQYSLGFGPCLAAAQAGTTIRIEDTSTDEVFRDFSSLAARRGVRSVVSVGLPVPDRSLGSINVYRFGVSADDGPGDETEQSLRLFAQYAAVALSNAAAVAESNDRADNLVVAMQSRAVIEQAKGVLVARHGVTPDAAFELLALRSQHENRKLRSIAEEVVVTAAGRKGEGNPSS